VLRLGLIGAGRWAKNYIRTIAGLTDAKLVRVARSRNLRDDLPIHDVEITTDWRRVAEAHDLDAVIIATPPNTHAELALATIAAGHPVLVEKPLTMNHDEAKTILDLAEQRNCLVMVEHTHLFNPAFRMLKALCAAERNIKVIDSIAGNWGVFRRDVTVLWDWGSHDVAMCLELLHEKPTHVAARLLEEREVPEGVGQSYALELTFRRGVKAKIAISNILDKKQRSFTVHISDGSFVYNDLALNKLIRRTGETEQPVEVEDTPPLTVAVREFIAAVRTGTRDLHDLRLAVDVTEVLQNCQRSLAHPS